MHGGSRGYARTGTDDREDRGMPRGIRTKPVPYCPDCGAQMALRRPKRDKSQFDPFWGCSQYPECRGTRDIREDGKPEMDDD